MCRQLSLLPLMHQFDYEGYIKNTTYWEIEEYKNNEFYMVLIKMYIIYLYLQAQFGIIIQLLQIK